jgi:hypothetical protein
MERVREIFLEELDRRLPMAAIARQLRHAWPPKPDTII